MQQLKNGVNGLKIDKYIVGFHNLDFLSITFNIWQ